MRVNLTVKPNLQLRSFYLFFMIVSIQIGVGIMGVPRIIFAETGRDSWLAVIIAFIYILFLLIAMFLILKQYQNADIFGIQVDLFGTWIGKLLGAIYVVYFGLCLFTVLITYIEVVTIFIFPGLNNFLMALLLIALIIYSVMGGIRVVVGVCFLFFILSHWLVLLLAQPIWEMDWSHFQPMFQSSLTELLKGARSTAYTFSGLELLFLIYPFVINKKSVKLPVYLGALWSALLVLAATVIVTGFFTPEEISAREWSVLGLFKIQSFSFVERFDYIVVTAWMMVTLPNMILCCWAITYGLKRLYYFPQKYSLYVLAAILAVASIFTKEHYLIQFIINFTAQLGFWLVYVYPFLLLILVIVKKRINKRNGGLTHAK
ncbi:spore germination protein [Virgibacillus sp. AGTR]|uniref:GerAB/ArcD/ProY family transporter n=1 Tax=Virgibacillus TaxID=84406 RepID=UPI000EF4E890|nr:MULTISPECIES: GerAB/ArcD/ProY family transporter [Virgibacillus]MCC2248374.1 spore germination protein [Virgibacillus sp. AGTR]QRZ16410.1 GerAB/ArcD/ProY family transporter [Virgibacillus sp. AGTR]WBX80096.1 GerAB/ArcD/ProY family transporter [Virgibacillus salarius]